MTITTIKVPKALRDRLKARAASHDNTLAEEIALLLDGPSANPMPRVGGFRSNSPLTAEEIDEALAVGFGR